MTEEQRKLQLKLSNGTLTKEEYKKINKRLYPLLARIEMCKRYNPVFYYSIYTLWIVFICTITSLGVVNFVVK